MKLYAPSYYDKFKCIGGVCPDNCCIGWEIDVDADMRARYELLDGECGERIRASISEENGTAHFRLDGGGRCPHLNGDNLCEIILRYGEDLLCEICREHPRYYSRLSDRCEVGVGLACPAAAELILDCTEPLVIEQGEIYVEVQEQNTIEPSKEERLISDAETLVRVYRESVWKQMSELTPRGVVLFADYFGRSKLCDLLFNVTAGFIPQEECLRHDYFISKPIGRLPYNAEEQRESVRAILASLEMLEPSFGEELVDALDTLYEVDEEFGAFLTDGGGEYFKRLLFYFMHRYLMDGIEDGSVHLRVRYSIICAFSVVLLGYLRGGERQSIIRAAVDFSRNVEYSDENLAIFLDGLNLDDGAGVDFIADALD